MMKLTIFLSLSTSRLQVAERRYCELEKEMERLKGEMQDWRTPKKTGKGSTSPLLHYTIIFIIISFTLYNMQLYYGIIGTNIILTPCRPQPWNYIHYMAAVYSNIIV